MQWPLEAENGLQLTANKKTVTLVLQLQELNSVNNSKKAGRTDSPLKTPKEMQPNDALILS